VLTWYIWTICASQENEFFSEDGIPKNQFPNGWKGNAGLYAVGFTKRGLSGASLDAISVAFDIAKSWKEETKQKKITVAARHRRCISHFWSHKIFPSVHFFSPGTCAKEVRSVCAENNVEHKNNEHSCSPLLKKTQDLQIIGLFFFVRRKMRLTGVMNFFILFFSPGSEEFFCITVYFNNPSQMETTILSSTLLSLVHSWKLLQLMGYISGLGPPQPNK